MFRSRRSYSTTRQLPERDTELIWKMEEGYQSMNKKQVEKELEVPKKKRKTLQNVCESLEADADMFTETAED